VADVGDLPPDKPGGGNGSFMISFAPAIGNFVLGDEATGSAGGKLSA
jgi:hypothetical protein